MDRAQALVEDMDVYRKPLVMDQAPKGGASAGASARGRGSGGGGAAATTSATASLFSCATGAVDVSDGNVCFAAM